MSQETELKKRAWVYLQEPSKYGVSGCSCGNDDVQWSEYEKHVWCPKCKLDFIPKSSGVFDGPVMLHTARMLGLDFSRYNIKAEKFEMLTDLGTYIDVQRAQDILDKKKINVILNDSTLRQNTVFCYETLKLEGDFKNSFVDMEFAINFENRRELKMFNLKGQLDPSGTVDILNKEEFNELLKMLLEEDVKNSKEDVVGKKVKI